MRKFGYSSIGFLVLWGISGCATGPISVQPQVSLPSQWHESLPGEQNGGVDEMKNWWTVFHDPLLDSLIDRAITANHDLRLAASRVREVRAQRGVVASDGWPQVNVSGQVSRNRSSSATQSGSSSNPSSSYSSGDKEYNFFQAGFDAQWELDFFGRIRNEVKAADADLEAAVDSQRDVLVTLLAELTRNYVELRGYQRRLSIAEENISTQKETFELTQSKYQAGLISELNVVQSRAQLSDTQSQVPVLQGSIRQTIHHLGILIGKEPGALDRELAPAQTIPLLPPQIPVGLPSDLLKRRPDIRQAERQLAAATARIGVAQADLFPRFSLTGSLGRRNTDFDNLTLGSSQFWGIGPAVSWPIFDAGRIRANIEVKNALQEQALTTYEKVVLRSLEDTENALSSYAMEQIRNRSLHESVEANQRALSLSQELYIKGLADFLNVLESQRSLYASQDLLIQSDQALALDVISIYKALGGGWEKYLPA